MKLSLGALPSSFVFALLALPVAGCAHAVPVSLTSAQAVASPAAPPTVPTPPVLPDVAPTSSQSETRETPAKQPVATSNGDLSFEQLTAQLGDDDKRLTLESIGGNGRGREISGSSGSGIKKVSAESYQGVGAARQAIATHEQKTGDVRVTGGLSIPQVRETVRGSAGRLRACYEAGLVQDPHLAGSVTVAFTVEPSGEVEDVDAEGHSMNGEVVSCVKGAFASMEFPSPKNGEVHVVYPVEFR